MKTPSLVRIAIKTGVAISGIYIVACAVLLPLFWPHTDAMSSLQIAVFDAASFPHDTLGLEFGNVFAVVAINAALLGVAAFLVVGAALHIYRRRFSHDDVVA